MTPWRSPSGTERASASWACCSSASQSPGSDSRHTGVLLMRVVSALALAGLILLGAADKGSARVHAKMHCWELDSEFPVLCEQDDEDDEASGMRRRGSGYRHLSGP